MPYVLGIDVGSTRTKAAVCRRAGGQWGPAEPVPLEGSSRWVDSVLHVASDASVLIGQAAQRRAAVDPYGLATAFLPRVGDGVAFILGEQRYTAEVLTAALTGWVADQVAEVERGPAERIVLTHPAGWGPHRRAVLHAALDEAGLPGVMLVPAVAAAAEARHDRQAVDVGGLVAVCRVGGQRTESAVLRRGPAGFEVLTHVESVEPQAGAYLDDLLAAHVRAELGEDAPRTTADVARLLTACTAAKERLSVTDEMTVAVPPRGVPVTRGEFERLALPALTAAIDQVRRIVVAAPDDLLTGVELLGGSARIPKLAELAEETLDCPVTADQDPGTVVCRGAALAARPRMARQESTALVTQEGPRVAELGEPLPPPPRPPVEITPIEAPRRGPAGWSRVLAGRRRDEDGE